MLTAPRDLLLNAKATKALVISNTSKTALIDINGWTGMNTQQTFTFGGGKRIEALPPSDDFCPDETCNGMDDDCDGETDEQWPDKGKGCAVGQGVCYQKGVLECAADGKSLRCSATAGAPKTETCNNLDDDCNGTVDDGWEEQKGDPCSVGKGVCRREGNKQCGGGGLQCSAQPGKPSAEACNGLDDDCDGDIDEGNVCPPGKDPCAGQGCGGNGTCGSGGGDTWCNCKPGFAAFGMTCTSQAKFTACNVNPPPLQPCPAACTGGCIGSLCIVRCAAKDACANMTLSCPKDTPCRIDCVGEGACKDAVITCQDGLLCDLRCLGDNACENSELNCGTGICTSLCSAAAGKLAKRDCSKACVCSGGCVKP